MASEIKTDSQQDSTALGKERPLSPHLTVYRWHLSMVMSIANRITGVALVFGTLLLGWLLIAVVLQALMYPNIYNKTIALVNTCPGYALLFGWTLALYYHLINGIRHLIWDTGHLLEVHTARRAGIVVLILTFLLTAITWYFGIYR